MDAANFSQKRGSRWIPAGLFVLAFALYAATAAPGALFGDPAEYQFIPAILGIAHPPGYAFYTLLAKLWQTALPVGTIAFRTNLLAAAAGAWGVTAVYLAVRELGERAGYALFAGLILLVSVDFWQHAIHANPHILSAALVATHLWLLLRWRRTERQRWLLAFAVILGISATHHPVTLVGLPAYGLFVLSIRPRIWRQPWTLLRLLGCMALGLLPLLYYPLRSPSAPFGPVDMRTWEGFWRHTMAQGLRGNLFHFGIADQLDRALVFWSLLRLQFTLPALGLIAWGGLRLLHRNAKPAIFLYVFLAIHLLFTLNTVQDVMAYLLTPFVTLSIVAGVGAGGIDDLIRERLRRAQFPVAQSALILGGVACMLLPIYQAGVNLARGVSLRDFTEADDFVSAVYERFGGRGEGAVLLSAWEYLTPLWARAYIDEPLPETDLNLVYVSTAIPWADAVWSHIEEGDIFLPDYRPAVRDLGFRLIPEGRLYQVVAPPVQDAPPARPLDVWADGRVHVLGYDLDRRAARAGEHLALTLYQSAPEPLAEIWMPYVQLGPIDVRWTTDNRLLTSDWLPGEIVIERYEIPIPFHLSPGEHPLRLGYADLSGGRDALPLTSAASTTDLQVGDLGVVEVSSNPKGPPPFVLERALANFDNQVALTRARARNGLQMRKADWRARQWEEPLRVRRGQAFHLRIDWRALASPRDSYTIFIHLIDAAGRPVLGHDYTPLGGACPSYLWFPKWLPGQALTDPYRLVIPDTLPPGDYALEVGMYGMTSLWRLPVIEWTGDLGTDRIILGAVRVE